MIQTDHFKCCGSAEVGLVNLSANNIRLTMKDSLLSMVNTEWEERSNHLQSVGVNITSACNSKVLGLHAGGNAIAMIPDGISTSSIGLKVLLAHTKVSW